MTVHQGSSLLVFNSEMLCLNMQTFQSNEPKSDQNWPLSAKTKVLTAASCLASEWKWTLEFWNSPEASLSLGLHDWAWPARRQLFYQCQTETERSSSAVWEWRKHIQSGKHMSVLKLTSHVYPEKLFNGPILFIKYSIYALLVKYYINK